MAKNIMLTRDEAELLVDLLMLTDNGHGHDLASEIRETFGMVSEDAELTARGMALDDVRKQFALPPDASGEIERLRDRLKWFEDSGSVAVHAEVFKRGAEIERCRKDAERMQKEIDRLREALREIRVCTSEHGGAAKALRIIKAALAKEAAP